MGTNEVWLFRIIQEILNNLFAPDMRRLIKARQDAAGKANTFMTEKPDGYRYMGTVFINNSPVRGQKLTAPPIEIIPEMDACLADEKKVNDDRKRLQQGLAILLSFAENYQDVGDALPDFMKDTCAGLQNFTRTREEGYSLLGDARGKRQYEKISQLMKFYHISRILY